ncbi:MAG TPA: porin family protein [Flavipsychrobacter sp.]|nr:porin family protein [Flavipsychrobacter sp.]HTN17832.1 porin family protein [Chitinophagaceae bacterium]
MQSTIKSAASIATIVLLMAFSARSSAQTSKFGISINSLITNFNYGSANNSLQPYKKNFSGLQAGFTYQLGITPGFSVVPELYFAMKGGTLKENNPLTNGKSTLRLYSIELPVLARVHFHDLYLNAGPYAGYNIGGRLKIDGTENTPETTSKISFGNSSGDFRRWDFGLQAGAGYNFKRKRSTLTVDVRYGYGLVSISRDVQRYNRMLNISLQVAKLKKKA